MGRAQDDDIAVALARSSHGLEAADHDVVQPDQAFAALVGCVLVADRPQRQRCGYRVERGLGNGDLDHAVRLPVRGDRRARFYPELPEFHLSSGTSEATYLPCQTTLYGGMSGRLSRLCSLTDFRRNVIRCARLFLSRSVVGRAL